MGIFSRDRLVNNATSEKISQNIHNRIYANDLSEILMSGDA